MGLVPASSISDAGTKRRDELHGMKSCDRGLVIEIDIDDVDLLGNRRLDVPASRPEAQLGARVIETEEQLRDEPLHRGSQQDGELADDAERVDGLHEHLAVEVRNEVVGQMRAELLDRTELQDVLPDQDIEDHNDDDGSADEGAQRDQPVRQRDHLTEVTRCDQPPVQLLRHEHGDEHEEHHLDEHEELRRGVRDRMIRIVVLHCLPDTGLERDQWLHEQPHAGEEPRRQRHHDEHGTGDRLEDGGQLARKWE